MGKTGSKAFWLHREGYISVTKGVHANTTVNDCSFVSLMLQSSKLPLQSIELGFQLFDKCQNVTKSYHATQHAGENRDKSTFIHMDKNFLVTHISVNKGEILQLIINETSLITMTKLQVILIFHSG